MINRRWRWLAGAAAVALLAAGCSSGGGGNSSASGSSGASGKHYQIGVSFYSNVIPLYVQQYQRTLQKGVGGYVDNPAYPNVVYVYDLKPSA